MKRNPYFRLSIEQENFKKRMWMHVCTKEYPPRIPLYSFLTIFLTKAKKTYRGYVSSYCAIDRSATSIAIDQFETSKKQFNQLLDTVLIVETRFLPHVRRYRLEKKYNTFLYTFVEFVMGIYDEQEHLIKQSKLHSDLVAA